MKELIPSITSKDNVTQLDIVLEAIRYIDSLQEKLSAKIESGDIKITMKKVGKQLMCAMRMKVSAYSKENV